MTKEQINSVLDQVLRNAQIAYVAKAIGTDILNPTAGYKREDGFVIVTISNLKSSTMGTYEKMEINRTLVVVTPWFRFLEQCDYTKGRCKVEVPPEYRHIFPDSIDTPVSARIVQELSVVRRNQDLIPAYIVVVLDNGVRTVSAGVPKLRS
jgi:hypothetical protein